jgi:histidine triad (HIT) family protein
LSYDPSNVFARILRGELPVQFLHEDEHCVAFRDIAPQAPVHVLVIPRAPLASLAVATPGHRDLLGHLLQTASALAAKLGLVEGGYRVVINTGAGAGQSVFHLHLHLLAGRSFDWPPG